MNFRMDIYHIGGSFRKCQCHHEVESKMIGVKENMLEAHLEVKNQLIRNLEDIIDEQEARIRNMDDFINGNSIFFFAKLAFYQLP